MGKSKAVTFWLAVFLGFLGIHRFYLGKYATGILWFLTSGFFAIGYVFDILLIAFDMVKDSNGERLEPPGTVHDLIIKVAAVVIVGSIVMSVYAFSQMTTTAPQGDFFDIPNAIKI